MSGLLACGLAAAPMVAGAKDSACYTGAEWTAFNVKVMQETLEDTALQCENVVGHNHDAEYNALIERARGGISADGELFQRHFRRVYGRGWEDKMDRFTTRIGNVAQSRSMASMTYCADSEILFNDVALANSSNLGVVAVDFNQAHFPNLGELGTQCPTKKVHIQVASRRTHHHHPRKVASSN